MGQLLTWDTSPLNAERVNKQEIRESPIRKDSGGSKKYPVKSYIAEGKSWDDTDDEEEQYGNLALMAESSRQVIITPYTPPFHTENLCENTHCIEFRKYVNIPFESRFDRMKVECTEKPCIDRYNAISQSYSNCLVSLKCCNGTVGDLKKN